MEKTLLFLLVFFMLSSCKKEGSVENTTTSDSALVDSTNQVNEDTLALQQEPLQTLDVEAALGKTLLKQDESTTILYFDQESQKGAVLVNGKSYELTEMKFSENAFLFSGPEVSARGPNGAFEEMTTDCLYGLIPELFVTVGSESTTLINLGVQHCPKY